MTRNEQPGSGLYDEDFYAWTQRQAAALRALSPSADDLAPENVAQLDIAHLAEEIEDSGHRDLREVMSDLGLVIQHLVKLRAMPTSRDAAHWHAEAVNFQLTARNAFSPGMRRLIDVDDIWLGGGGAAGRFLKDAGARDPATDPCPFTLDDLLARDFEVDAAVGRIEVGCSFPRALRKKKRAAVATPAADPPLQGTDDPNPSWFCCQMKRATPAPAPPVADH